MKNKNINREAVEEETILLEQETKTHNILPINIILTFIVIIGLFYLIDRILKVEARGGIKHACIDRNIGES
ncbi:hypothetical protein C922_04225 [Plasmodium inui San Antonio 1]|uniref:Uncharacterized protein n=1 Tax=Plasmodium inui San Antonio 1 TaxID=1237626 RepID=W7A1C8_9APIC|nr:hypothetical protein C922_04225 [Plasmodium inui San Antonio 1]EUD65485.1 hypothetical protein C922_04225 [Plasmodium inui San Antonio 1]